VLEGIDLSRTVGWFTSLFPAVLELGEDGPLATLRSVKEQLRAIPGRGLGHGLLLYLHGDVALSQRLRELPRPGLSFLYLGRLDPVEGDGLFAPAAERVGALRSPRGRRPHLIEVTAGVFLGQLRVSFSYSENLHLASTVEALAEGTRGALRSLVDISPRAYAHTASDFPAARLGPGELGKFLSSIGTRGGKESR